MPDYILSGIVIQEWFNRISDLFNYYASCNIFNSNNSIVIISNDSNNEIKDVRLHDMFNASDWSIFRRTPFIILKPDNYIDETSVNNSTSNKEYSFTFRGIKIHCTTYSNGNEFYWLYHRDNNINNVFFKDVSNLISDSDRNMSPIFLGRRIEQSFRDHMLKFSDRFYMPTKHNQMMFTLHKAACIAAIRNNRLPTYDDFKGLDFKDEIPLSELKIGLNPLFKEYILNNLGTYNVTADWIEEVTAPYSNMTISNNNIVTQ